MKLMTFYVICTLEQPRAPIIHAIGTKAHDADDAIATVKKMRSDASVLGVVGGHLASSEEEALDVWFGTEHPVTKKEAFEVYSLIVAFIFVLVAIGYVVWRNV